MSERPTVTREIMCKLHNRRVRLATLSDGTIGINWVRLEGRERKAVGIRLSREAAKSTAVGIFKLLFEHPHFPPAVSSAEADRDISAGKNPPREKQNG